ncbi:MAG: hypothetical protein GY758_24865, partial [Fuerstiella sp.]|nr:hypothetical protein [Fuerstiella sp.]
GRRPAEELYDLRTDSHQMYNVAHEERYAEVKSDLSDRLMGVLMDTGDPRVTGDGTAFDLPPFATEWKRNVRPKQRETPRKDGR